MQSYRVANLLIPGDPIQMPVTTPNGVWTFEQMPNYMNAKAAIQGGAGVRPQNLPVAETYLLEHPTGPSAGQAAADRVFNELTPILLAASYAMGMSISIDRSSSSSEILIGQPSSHWPRIRAIDQMSPAINTSGELRKLIERFLVSWPNAGQSEKALLLVHHWIDSLACWSMEDLYLSATTLLQIIAATEERVQGKDLHFFNAIVDASKRAGITPLSRDFKDMRNQLVHDGNFIGVRFAGPDKASCEKVISDVMNWIDEYIHSVLNLGPVVNRRFRPSDFSGLNSYSI